MIDLPQEVRVLNTTAELVESMVNHLICCFNESGRGPVTEVRPKDVIQEKYFFVLLLEMFTPVSAELVPKRGHGECLLTIIRQISDRAQLCSVNAASVKRLGRCSQEFLDWLSHEFTRTLYSQDLGKTVHLTISRRDALYLVGTRCKHTLVRSDRIIRKLVQKYRNSGVAIAEDEEALVLDDIDTWFLEDFGNYHFTKLCELCSNLYHAIIEYVRPEYETRSRIEGGIARLRDVPAALTRSDHISEFYELFNRVRNPWVPFIRTGRHLTLRY